MRILTDIHTGWVESLAVLGKGQRAVHLADREEGLPFPRHGLDSDNVSEFILAKVATASIRSRC